MSTSAYDEFIEPLLIPVITALVGAAIATFQDWRERRSQRGRRKLVLEDARGQVAFITEWWGASKALGLSASAHSEAADRAGMWLAEASERVAANPAPEPPVDQPGVWRRLLLAYPLQAPAARAIRVAFYLLLGWTPIVLGAGASNLVMMAGVAQYNLAIAVAVVLLGIALRSVALAIERHTVRRATPGGPEQGWFQTVMLLRTLTGPARAGRLAMYVLIATLLVYLVVYLRNWGLDPVWAAQYLPLTAGTSLALVAAIVGVRSWALHLDRRDPDIDSAAADHDSFEEART